jgi:CRP/FNR family transcriptional regulator
MNPADVVLGTGSRLAQQLRPTEVSFLETIYGQGDCLQLRPQQRVPLPPAEKVIVLREGILAVDAMPAKGKLQVLDFLEAGDVVSAPTILSTPGISLRAITRASLVSLDPPTADSTLPAHDYWTFLIGRCRNQMARLNMHQLMIGRLETESRIASFILSRAIRNRHEGTDSLAIMLPMSRTDIANYLVINCDTLSRTMMRLCDSGIIERVSRHAIRVIDFDALRKKSPLASLLSVTLAQRNRKRETGTEPGWKRSASMLSAHDKPSTIQSAGANGVSPRPGAGYHYT